MATRLWHSPSTTAFPPKNWRTHKFAMVTAFDYVSGMVCGKLEFPILVGDSLANTTLGLSRTKDVGMQEMVHHLAAVRRGAPNAYIITDMPFGSDTTPNKALTNGMRLIQQGCNAVKIEGAKYDQVRLLSMSAIDVVGHIGVCPQTCKSFKVQGLDRDSTKRLVSQAVQLERAGAIALVLENIAPKAVDAIMVNVKVATIGIYSGDNTNGQIRVFNDLMGLPSGYSSNKTSSNSLVDVYKLYISGLTKFRENVRCSS